MTVLTAVDVSITNDVMFIMVYTEMAINIVVLVNPVVDTVLICAEDRRVVFIPVFDDILVYVSESLMNEKPNPPVLTDECHDWRFV